MTDDPGTWWDKFTDSWGVIHDFVPTTDFDEPVYDPTEWFFGAPQDRRKKSNRAKPPWS